MSYKNFRSLQSNTYPINDKREVKLQACALLCKYIGFVASAIVLKHRPLRSIGAKNNTEKTSEYSNKKSVLLFNKNLSWTVSLVAFFYLC